MRMKTETHTTNTGNVQWDSKQKGKHMYNRQKIAIVCMLTAEHKLLVCEKWEDESEWSSHEVEVSECIESLAAYACGYAAGLRRLDLFKTVSIK